MTLNLIHFIKQIVPFTDEEIQKASCLFTENSLKKGEFLIKEGEFNSDIIFVNKGMLRAYFVKDETEKTYDLAIENQIITVLNSYILDTPSTDCIQAIEDTSMSIISKENLETLFSQSAKWERLGRLIFQNYTHEQEVRLRSFIAETAQERYERLATEKPELLRRTPQIYLANFLGITPQSLSRLRRKIVNK